MHDNGQAPAIVIAGLRRRFGDIVAVDGISLDVREGEVLGLLGHNGAGKTTLIRLINGLLRPDDGTIRVFGLDPMEHGAEVRARVGVLTTYPALEEWLTPLENLRIHADVNGIPSEIAEPRMRDLLTRFTIDPLDTAPSRGLSAGQKQRVAMARALVHDPDLLLLDEPTANLDPIAAKDVRDVIRQLARERGRTVVMSTHNLAEAQAICDRVAILREGALLDVGTPEELSSRVEASAVVVVRVGIDQAVGAATALGGDGLDARPDGSRAVVVHAVPGQVPDLVRTLVAAGVDVHAVEARAGQLEDAYVDLHAGLPDLEPVRRNAPKKARR